MNLLNRLNIKAKLVLLLGMSTAALLVTYREASSTGVSPATAQILVRLLSEVPLFESVSCEVM